MTNSDAHIGVMMGMIGGPALAVDTLNRIGRNDLSRGSSEKYVEIKLPRTGASEKDKEALRKAGCILHDKWPDGRNDPLFLPAQAPLGWKVQPTDHYMYSNLLDEQGRTRARIGYKYTDSWANLTVLNRFSANYTNDSWNKKGAPDLDVPTIQDSNGKTLWRGKPMKHCASDSKDARAIAADVLTKHYPKWAEPDAYWELAEADVKFPKSESAAPTGKKYELFIEIYHKADDHYSADSGMNNSTLAETEQEGIRVLEESAKGMLSNGYQKVKYQVYCEGKTVKSGEFKVSPPRQARRRYVGVNGEFHDGSEW